MHDAKDTRTAVPQTSGNGQHEPLREPLHDVFVSYSTRDKPVADAIVSRLEQAGIRCWVAPRDILPGRMWGEAIVEAIQTSRLMVVVLSGQANHSQQVIREVERAVAHEIVVIPFRIESVEPTGAMAYYLASEHWLDAMTPPLEAHIAQLVTVTQTLLGTTPTKTPHTEDPVTAPPVPTAPPRRSRRRLVGGLAAAGALVILGIVAAILFARPSGEEPQRVALSQLTAGDCLADPEGAESAPSYWDTMPYWPERVSVVPCEEPHTAEVVFVGDIWDANTPNPGQNAIDEEAWARCESAFESYVGVSLEDSVLWMQMWDPDAATWDSGDRQIGCVAYDLDGKELEGSIQ